MHQCAGLLGLTYVPARAQTATGGVAAGSLPISVAVNPDDEQDLCGQ